MQRPRTIKGRALQDLRKQMAEEESGTGRRPAAMTWNILLNETVNDCAVRR